METLETQKLQKNYKEYSCQICNYMTCRKSSYDKHLLTSKHMNIAKINDLQTKSCKNVQNISKKYMCEICDKEFKNRSGLWKHKKKSYCKSDSDNNNYDYDIKNIINKINQKNTNQEEIYELLQYLLQENNELKQSVHTLVNVIETLKNNPNPQ
jgi:hypothetical protein